MALIPCNECGKSISDRAVACPQCGAPTGRGTSPAMPFRAYRWRTKAELFGLPFIHVAIGGDATTGSMRGVAKGIIALGDIAVGVLAVGGAAFGGITIGGFSVGLVSLGGAALGILLGVGGFATGYIAIGGLAIGYYATGGLAIGAHVISGASQDPEAIEFFRRFLGSVVDKLSGRR
jgi:hypothetical protein